jgi:hypothetical protein
VDPKPTEPNYWQIQAYKMLIELGYTETEIMDPSPRYWLPEIQEDKEIALANAYATESLKKDRAYAEEEAIQQATEESLRMEESAGPPQRLARDKGSSLKSERRRDGVPRKSGPDVQLRRMCISRGTPEATYPRSVNNTHWG